MGTSNPSRSKGSRATAGKESNKVLVSLISLELSDSAPPLLEMKGRKTHITPTGRVIEKIWRSFGENRPYLIPDAFLLGQRNFRGILRLQTGDSGAPTLAETMRLFKVLVSRTLATNSVSPSSKASPIWKRGYTVKVLSSLKQIVDAQRALGQ